MSKLDDNLDKAFKRACDIMVHTPHQAQLAGAIILLADHVRQLELRIAGTQSGAAEQAPMQQGLEHAL